MTDKTKFASYATGMKVDPSLKDGFLLYQAEEAIKQLTIEIDDLHNQITELFKRLPKGAHWCAEYDELLVLPGDPEWENCMCTNGARPKP